MIVPKNEDRILVDGEVYTHKELVYAIRLYERTKLRKKESMKRNRQKKKMEV